MERQNLVNGPRDYRSFLPCPCPPPHFVAHDLRIRNAGRVTRRLIVLLFDLLPAPHSSADTATAASPYPSPHREELLCRLVLRNGVARGSIHARS